MASGRQIRGLQGLTQLRRKLKRMPDAVNDGVREAVRDILKAVQLDAIARVPVDTGRLREAISVQISSDGFAGSVGPGAALRPVVSRFANKLRKTGVSSSLAAGLFTNATLEKVQSYDDLFYAPFVEFGTKGYTPNIWVTHKSGKNEGKKTFVYKRSKTRGGRPAGHFYGTKTVAPQPARPFMGPAWDVNKAWALKRSHDAVTQALQKAVTGD